MLSTLDGEARLTAEYQAQLGKIAELEAQSKDRAAADAARAALAIEHEHELSELREAAAAEELARSQEALKEWFKIGEERKKAEKDARDKATADEIAATEERRSGRSMAIDSVSSLYASAADAQMMKAEELAETDRAAAMKAFERSKALSIASATISGAEAVAKTLAKIPPPLGILAAAAMAAAVAVQVGKIKAQQPTFHTGTGFFAPDEGAAVLQRGEGVVTSAAP